MTALSELKHTYACKTDRKKKRAEKQIIGKSKKKQSLKKACKYFLKIVY